MAVSQALTLSVVDQLLPENTSYIRMLWTSTQTGASYNNNQKTATYWIKVNEQDPIEYTVSYTLPKNTTQTIIDRTFEVGHRADGTCTVLVTTEMDTGISAGVVKKEATIIPTSIPRQSIVSATSAIIGDQLTILIARNSISYNHTLSYQFGNLSGQIAAGVNAPSYSWTLPEPFYEQIPDAKSRAGTITCITYSGNKQIGSSSTPFTAYVAESAAPSVSASVRDVNEDTLALTGDESVMVRGFSRASVSISATAKLGSSIKSYRTLCGDGKTLSSATGTISAVESGSFTCSATDSRGYSTSKKINLMMIEYIKLTCNMNVQPVNGVTGIATLAITGNYFAGSFGDANNNLVVQYRYKENDGSYTAWQTSADVTISSNKYSCTVEIPDLDYTLPYTFQSRAVDKLTSVATPSKRVKTTPVFHWGENDFAFNVPVYAPSIETGGFTGDISALQKSMNITASLTDALTTPIMVVQELYPRLGTNSIYYVCIPGGTDTPGAYIWIGKTNSRYGYVHIKSFSVNPDYNCEYRLYDGVWEQL